MIKFTYYVAQWNRWNWYLTPSSHILCKAFIIWSWFVVYLDMLKFSYCFFLMIRVTFRYNLVILAIINIWFVKPSLFLKIFLVKYNLSLFGKKREECNIYLNERCLNFVNMYKVTCSDVIQEGDEERGRNGILWKRDGMIQLLPLPF